MNSTTSFIAGWATFSGCVFGGAYMGYSVFAEQHEKNLVQNEILKREREQTLINMKKRWADEAKESEITKAPGGLQRRRTTEEKQSSVDAAKEKEPAKEPAKKPKVEQFLYSSHANRVGGQADVRKWGD